MREQNGPIVSPHICFIFFFFYNTLCSFCISQGLEKPRKLFILTCGIVKKNSTLLSFVSEMYALDDFIEVLCSQVNMSMFLRELFLQTGNLKFFPW